jgi:hypothetical protein
MSHEKVIKLSDNNGIVNLNDNEEILNRIIEADESLNPRIIVLSYSLYSLYLCIILT